MITLCGEESAAPVRTTCARRMAYGRCSCSLTSWPRPASRRRRSSVTIGPPMGVTCTAGTTTKKSMQVAADLMDALREKLPSLPGQRFGEFTVEAADDFAYTD